MTVGVDTHLDIHVAVALDQFGRKLDTIGVPTNGNGHRRLLEWTRSLGVPGQFGIEGTGSYGVGLTRYLRRHGIDVVEVIRPARQKRRLSGKSDALDAEAAARAVQAGTVLGQAKSQDGAVEMIRALRVARKSAMHARTNAANQLHAIVVTAPEQLRDRLRGLPITKLVETATRFRPGTIGTLEAASKLALKSLAGRYRNLSEEITSLDAEIEHLAHQAAPNLFQVKGIGADTGAALLIAAGDNPDRLRSEAAFAHMCGAAPIPASSGKTTRHRLNPGGNREANRALHMLAINRLSYDPRARSYAARRTAEGKSKKEIIRCLKRYLAREIFRALTSGNISIAPPIH
ncbi:IS110 family transposase [Nocardia terpenica]|nr:IS110 family transposase [Nocardia terpenica]MBF6106101.1 IS110 family transposase [Nocardia terpenica]MBF6113314.1 IS110 family transposase [Nocardia terpenica]MBF6119842.1 IS110 family transposase [Nocardia terpenica]MBF6152253.1 IS110 family transposase [Nocardia terpenica]